MSLFRITILYVPNSPIYTVSLFQHFDGYLTELFQNTTGTSLASAHRTFVFISRKYNLFCLPFYPSQNSMSLQLLYTILNYHFFYYQYILNKHRFTKITANVYCLYCIMYRCCASHSCNIDIRIYRPWPNYYSHLISVLIILSLLLKFHTNYLVIMYFFENYRFYKSH